MAATAPLYEAEMLVDTLVILIGFATDAIWELSQII